MHKYEERTNNFPEQKVQKRKTLTKALQTAVFIALTAFAGSVNSAAAQDSISVQVTKGTTKDTVSVTSSDESIKSAINVGGTVTDMIADFTSGTLSVSGNDSYTSSSILTEVGGIITNLNADFTGANVTVNGGNPLSGALIKSLGEITSADVSIKNTTMTSDADISGGLIGIDSVGKIGSFTGTLSGNNLTASSGAGVTGGVLYNRGTLGGISNGMFSSNTVTSDTGEVNGGAVANAGGTITGDISGTTFSGNSVSSAGNVKGGAVYNTGILGGKILNTSFTDNSAASTAGTALGAAIYTTTDMTIAADNSSVLFKNNTISGSNTNYKTLNQAIYVDSTVSTLTLDAVNNGSITIYDDVSGASGYKLVLSGDSTSSINLWGDVTNANITATGGNISFANDEVTKLNMGQFTTADDAKYTIDLNLANGTADTFVTSTGSSGTIY